MYAEHNSHSLFYRNPFGACPVNTEVTLRLAISSSAIPEKVLCIMDNHQLPMYFTQEINGSYIYECKTEMPDTPKLVFYCFYIQADGDSFYYGNNDRHSGGKGKSYGFFPDSLYQITVHKQDFKTPDWMKNGVVYQIFPDRFFRGKETPFHGIERSWNDEPFYREDQFGGKYLSNDFFGGNLDGIRQKLPYLKDLGITVIYLNPISKAFSNHRYDTGDYEIPDDTLGTLDDFVLLAAEAQKMGIKIILDGVFSHTGADSKYFNKYGHYDSLGAAQSKDSPYYSWYKFTEYPHRYESWWGFDTLPNLNELEEGFISYIAKDKNSVIKKWLRHGASGFRLDVADELPDEFIKIIRTSLKEENPDALLIGEVWEDASNKVSYGEKRAFLMGEELDSVMNYVFREAVLGYLTSTNAEAFSEKLYSLFENYPKESLYSAMNMLSSHDVPRALTVLSGAPDFRSLSRQQQHDYIIDDGAMNLAKMRMVLATAIQMTLPGAPTVYYGDEAEMYGFADPFNRAPMNWEKEEGEIFRQIKLFSILRGEKEALRTGFCTILYAGDGVISYMRHNENGSDAFGKKSDCESIIVIINASDSVRYTDIDLGRFGVSSFRDTLSGDFISGGSTLSMELMPFSYRLITPEGKK